MKLYFGLCCALILGMIGIQFSGILQSSEQPEDKTVSVTQFGRGSVIGHLGHPLGTVVRVTGKSLGAGRREFGKAYEGVTMLSIETVNGVPLKRPALFGFRRASTSIKKPQDGQAFDYYVHEWGAFDGVVTAPKGLGIEQVMVANDGFYYHAEIAIHKAN